jgi:hypothetical protein
MTIEKTININDFVKMVNGKPVKKSGRPTALQARQQGKTTGTQQRVAGSKDVRNLYTEQQKMEAVCTFAVSGNSRRVAEITGIPEATIRAWKQTEWWYEANERILKEEDEELDVKLSALINKAVSNVNDRLEHGDFIYDVKRAELVRRPMSGRDTAVVTAITLDKRQLLRGQPTSRVERVSQDERLLRLAEQFKTFSSAKEVLQVPTKDEEAQEAFIVEENTSA